MNIKSNPIFVAVIGVVAMVIGAIMFFGQLQIEKEEQLFMERAATVDVYTEQVNSRVEGSGRNKHTVYSVTVSYEYNDTIYEHVVIDDLGSEAKTLEQGDWFIAYVDPNNPRDCRLQTTESHNNTMRTISIVIAALGLLATIFSVWSLIARHKRNKTAITTPPYNPLGSTYQSPDNMNDPFTTFTDADQSSSQFGAAPSQNSSFGGQPVNNGYNAPTQPSNGFADNQNGGYGSYQSDNQFGSSPSQNNYFGGQPVNNGYNAPTQPSNGLADNQNGSYGSYQSDNQFGSAPSQNNYFGGQPVNNGYNAPVQPSNGFADNQSGSYGSSQSSSQFGAAPYQNSSFGGQPINNGYNAPVQQPGGFAGTPDGTNLEDIIKKF